MSSIFRESLRLETSLAHLDLKHLEETLYRIYKTPRNSGCLCPAGTLVVRSQSSGDTETWGQRSQRSLLCLGPCQPHWEEGQVLVFTWARATGTPELSRGVHLGTGSALPHVSLLPNTERRGRSSLKRMLGVEYPGVWELRNSPDAKPPPLLFLAWPQNSKADSFESEAVEVGPSPRGFPPAPLESLAHCPAPR